MKQLTYIAIAFVLSISIVSCTKIIDVNIDNTEPAYVIEANIDDAPGPYYVRITKTIDLDKDNNFPGITGATVRISDDAGNDELLSDNGSGYYATTSLQGTPGRTYTLTVEVEGKTYTSVCKMPTKVPFDSLGFEEVETFDGLVPYPTVYYTDPVGVGNYYRAIRYKNGVPDGEMYIESDEFIDGKSRSAVLFNGDSDEVRVLAPGDTVTVEMRCIDRYVYEYLEQLLEADGNSNAATPANPKSNIQGGALGYFSAHTSEIKKLDLPE